MTLTITCVVDNNAQPGSGLQNEHGLAFWIASEAGAMLFDTGQSGAVLRHNLAALNLDTTTLKAVAISHTHYDHTGGLPALVELLAPGLSLYANAALLLGAVVGGAHLGSADADTLTHIADTLHKWGTLRRIYLNHRSGESAYHTLRQVMGDNIAHPCPAGTRLDLEAEL